jgi:hypothetical protein
MREHASLVGVLVAMRVLMAATIGVGVHVNPVAVVDMSVVGVILVSKAAVVVIAVRIVQVIRVGNIRVILIASLIRVITMVVVKVVRVRLIPVVFVRGVYIGVVVIAMLHIPEILVRWFLRRTVQMVGTIPMISMSGRVGVIAVERPIEVVGMAGVVVIVEREIAVCVGVIAMVGVRVYMGVAVRLSAWSLCGVSA